MLPEAVIGKMFGSRHLPAPKIFFRFSWNFGAEGQPFLKWLHNILDDADVTHIFKDKGKLNRIKNHPKKSIILWNVVLFFENFIFEQRTFLPFTRNHNNYWWLVKPENKSSEDKLDYHKNGGNEQIACHALKSLFFSCYD